MHKVSMQLQYAKVRGKGKRIGTTRDKGGRDQEKRKDEEDLTPL